MKPFKLEIISPERTIFSGSVTSVVVPATGGKMGILANHAPIIASLDAGPMKVAAEDGTISLYAIGGGFVEAGNNLVLVIADVAEPADVIDEERAKKAEERARARLREGVAGQGAADVDLVRAEAALARALARIQALGALRGLRHSGARERHQAGGGVPH